MLATKNIFLDTSVIVQQKFDYQSPALRRLEELAVSGNARLLTTPITTREVESNIREALHNARTAHERFKSNHAILKNLPEAAALFEAADYKAMEERLITQYHDFLARTNCEVLPLDLASVDDVFSSYFDRTPPFGEGKKKAEFPDAFVLSVLEGWCKKEKERVYVVTTDPDMVSYCGGSNRLLLLERPGEYIDAFLRQDAAMRIVEQTTREQEEQIEKAVATEFGQLGFYIDDQEGDVNDINVNDVSIEGIDLLAVADHSATFEVVVNVDFVVDVSYDDMETAIWDSEDKVAIPLRRIEREIERTEELTATVEVALDRQGQFASVSKVTIPTSDIGIPTIDEDWYK